MSVFFISDLHLGHKNILKFSPTRHGTTIAEHDKWLLHQWNSVVRSDTKDVIWVLGDVCFSQDTMWILKKMRGRKKLVRGNHDVFPTEFYMLFFEEIHGITKKYHRWLSHAPVHPDSLRDRQNIHGHLHQGSVKVDGYNGKIVDKRYINVCVEHLNGTPMSLEQLNNKYG